MDIRQMARQFKLVVKRSSRTTKIAVCAAVTLSVVTMLVLHAATLDAREQAEHWRQQAQQLEQENDRLQSQIDNLGTAEGVGQIAQDELGLVPPDTIIIQPEN